MENHIWKFKQTSIVFEKPGLLLKNLKILRAPSTTKACSGFFFFFLDLEFFAKIKKDLVSAHSTQYLNKIKKNPEHTFVNIIK